MIQCFELLGTGVLTCHLLRISVARYLRWMQCRWFSAGGFGRYFDLSLDAVRQYAMAYSVKIRWQSASIRLGFIPHMTLWRSLATLAATYLFVLTTPFTQMIRLLQMSRLPKVLIEQMLLTYRFILFFWKRRLRSEKRNRCALAIGICVPVFGRWRC